MDIDPSIFKAYDIRGTFPDQINAGVAELIGRAFSDILPKGGVAVGRDMRLDSGELAQGFMRGLTQQGREVIDIGLVASDMAAFASGFYDLAGAAMITASHNPGKYNGIKLCATQAQPISIESGEDKIKTAVLAGTFKSTDSPGSITQRHIDADWVRHALSFVNASQWPSYQLAVDAANGMMGKIWPLVSAQVEQLVVTPMYFELDGSFPNHQPNPAVAANLADLTTTVNSHHLDLGVAFDGDGDRAFFVDETGQPLTASQTAAILAGHLLAQSPGSIILYDLRMSKIVPETIQQLGGVAIRTPVGGGNIKPLARQHDALLACEGSGHYYYRDNYYSDSGLITALMMLEIMATSGQKLSQLAAPLQKYAHSGEINLAVTNPTAVLERVANTYESNHPDYLDGLSVDLGDRWFNLRASNTEPLMRLNVEANTADVMKQQRDQLVRLIQE